MILDFLDEQILNLKYRDQQLYDLSAIIEEKVRGNKAYKSRYNTLHGKTTYDQKQSKEAKGLRGGSSASNEKQVAVTGVGKREKKLSCIIHPFAQHKITECEVFLEKEVNERREFVKVNGLCFYCMQKHFAKYCPNKTPCSQCNGGHSQLLHQNDANRNKPEGDNSSAKVRKSNLPEQLKAAGSCVENAVDDSNTECMATVPIIGVTCVQDEGDNFTELTVYAMPDTGADISICTKELTEKLFGWVPNNTINVQFLENSPDQYPCMIRSLQLRWGDQDIVNLPNLPFVDITLPFSQHLPGKNVMRKYQLEENCFPFGTDDCKVDMILGARDIRKFRVFETCVWNSGPLCKPLLGVHPLGTIFWGLENDTKRFHYICAMHSSHEKTGYAEHIPQIVSHQHNISLDECREYLPLLMHDIDHYYKDQLIVEPESELMVMSKEDEKVLAFYEEIMSEVTDANGQLRLQFSLPWKEGYPIEVSKCLDVAKNCLRGQVKRLSKDSERAKKYTETFEKMKQEKQAELVHIENEPDGKSRVASIHYLTHFATQQKKFRVLYNGALKIDGISINDMLYKGPMFLQSLVGILMRFRQFKYAVTADIRNMFFQISLYPDDRNMLRFLPFTGPSVSQSPEVWRFNVMPYGLICVPSIASFSGQYTASKNYARVSQDTVLSLKQDFYVDDFISSVKTIEEAKRVLREAKITMGTTGFVLTKFNSNCSKVVEEFDSNDLAPLLKELNENKQGVIQQKTLGMSWNSNIDTIEMHINAWEKNRVLTRRTALSCLNSFYDPLGLWCQFLVKLKLCYSKIVSTTVSWDDEVKPTLQEEWTKAVEEMQKLPTFQLSRAYTKLSSGETELHIFSDASQHSMGACVYLRRVHGRTSETALVVGKSRLFPKD